MDSPLPIIIGLLLVFLFGFFVGASSAEKWSQEGFKDKFNRYELCIEKTTPFIGVSDYCADLVGIRPFKI